MKKRKGKEMLWRMKWKKRKTQRKADGRVEKAALHTRLPPIVASSVQHEMECEQWKRKVEIDEKLPRKQKREVLHSKKRKNGLRKPDQKPGKMKRKTQNDVKMMTLQKPRKQGNCELLRPVKE